MNVDSWHEAVFQCVAENSQGMNVTSTRVHVEGKCVGKKKNEAPKFCGVIISHFCLLVCKSLTKRRRSDDVFFVPQRAEVPGRATLLDHVIQLLAPTSLCNGFKF